MEEIKLVPRSHYPGTALKELKNLRLIYRRWVREFPNEPWTPEIRKQLVSVHGMIRKMEHIWSDVRAHPSLGCNQERGNPTS